MPFRRLVALPSGLRKAPAEDVAGALDLLEIIPAAGCRHTGGCYSVVSDSTFLLTSRLEAALCGGMLICVARQPAVLLRSSGEQWICV